MHRVKSRAARTAIRLVLWGSSAFVLMLTMAPKRYRIPAP